MSSMIVHTVSNFSLISFLSVLLSLEVQAAPKQLSRIVSKLNSMISNHDQHNIFFFIFSCHNYVLRNLFKRSFICLSWKLPSRLLPRHSLHFPFKDVRANCFCTALMRTKFTPSSCIELALGSKVNNNRANGLCYNFAWI